MKTPFALFALLALAPAAAAQKTYDLSTCESVTFTALTDSYVVSWKTDAVFPNSPESLVSYKIFEDFTIKCPEITVTDTKAGMTVKFKDSETMLKYLFSSEYSVFNILHTSWYDYPSVQVGYNDAQIGFNRKFELIEDRSRPVRETVGYRFAESVVGYKVNGAPLKPLIFNGKVQPLQATTKDRIEFYTRFKASSSIVKVVFDFKAGFYSYETVKEFPQ